MGIYGMPFGAPTTKATALFGTCIPTFLAERLLTFIILAQTSVATTTMKATATIVSIHGLRAGSAVKPHLVATCITSSLLTAV